MQPVRNTVLASLAGSGSALVVAQSLGCDYLAIALDARYHAAATARLP
jgi:DNA modification methylase